MYWVKLVTGDELSVENYKPPANGVIEYNHGGGHWIVPLQQVAHIKYPIQEAAAREHKPRTPQVKFQ